MALPFDSVAAVLYIYRDRASYSLRSLSGSSRVSVKLYRDVIYTNRIQMRTPKVS
ncbi:uncharacterized protein K452DRAFT_291298 [Aplosporella prunicola CBS 121167]|uniref:Uncharacterized protein n=1 Tax=Aplosporella prunicola CBS 121167 TaxID=1176127 RepID=A0A6A6B0I9_9PEZI|nr:uncharacterized protein K452DRAFT_291298 [Aplosporella prunicola CBS 121167]KAF2137692.1 hypothetical protein K452DRAFT_291298 [Aplosporella prunicola CBS 121167]